MLTARIVSLTVRRDVVSPSPAEPTFDWPETEFLSASAKPLPLSKSTNPPRARWGIRDVIVALFIRAVFHVLIDRRVQFTATRWPSVRRIHNSLVAQSMNLGFDSLEEKWR